VQERHYFLPLENFLQILHSNEHAFLGVFHVIIANEETKRNMFSDLFSFTRGSLVALTPQKKAKATKEGQILSRPKNPFQ
jgi:hypothetical protein